MFLLQQFLVNYMKLQIELLPPKKGRIFLQAVLS